MALTSEAIALPKSIQSLIEYAIKELKPTKVILFGSRARKDHHEGSDYDLAFCALNNPDRWSRFLAEVEEKPITLLKVDLLMYESISAEYRKNIDKDGVLIYERKPYQNFEIALRKLSEFSAQELKDDLDRAGLIQGFEFTFEQCWKSIQKLASIDGIKIASPKSAFTWAIEKGWIPNQDEFIWLNMLNDRNLTSHTYREEMATEIVSHIQKDYVTSLTALLTKMKL